MATMSSTGHPAYDTVTEVRFDATGATRVCWVAASDAKRLVLAAPPERGRPSPAPRRGDVAQVMWVGARGLRSLPVELLGVQKEIVPLWHFRRVGPEVAAQRRTSVRADLKVPVEVTRGGLVLRGTTLDLSEGGVQCAVQATSPVPPQLGDEVSIAMSLDEGADPFRARGAIIRIRPSAGDRWRLTVKFVGLENYELDLLRTRVFHELRDQRAHDMQ
jgi:c-di-GMP-binding flagellar brake protein YcgR